MKANQSKSKGGRPRIKIDWRLIANLCEIQCTTTEIAAALSCSVDTLERAARRERGMGFAEFYQQKAQAGHISLRRAQWRAAQRGNSTMLVWLGKNLLGQRDHRDQTPGDPSAIARATRDLVLALFATEPPTSTHP